MTELHPNVLAALRHPQRGMEVRGWLKTHGPDAVAWRGEMGESMMHWAFLSDWVLACELRDKGLAFDVKDNQGRTAFDWLTDRLYGAVLNNRTKGVLSKGGEERLIKHTEQQGMQLWAMGARPTLGHPFYGSVWLQAGAFEMLPMVLQEYGPLQWMPHGGSALHASVLAPSTPKKKAWIDQLLQHLSVDQEDEQGRTPLWYTLDTWLKHPPLRPSLLAMLEEWVRRGADMHHKDSHGYSPLDVLSFDQDAMTPELKRVLKLSVAPSLG